MKWEKIEIGKICDVGRGSSPRPIDNPAYFVGGTIPWVKIADATASGKYIYQTKEVVNEFGASFSRRLQPGALIIATSGVSLGQIKFLGVEGCIHDGWLFVNNFRGVDKEFLYYHLLTMQEEFLGRAYGAAIQNINTNILRESKINFPPLPTQRRIASILSVYDDLIENNLKRIKLLEEKAFLRYKQIVNSEKNTPTPFSEVADYINGYPFKPEEWKDKGLPIIKIKELKGGIQADTPRNDGENIPDKYFIENADILFAWSASIGAYFWSSGKAILNQHIFNVKAFDKEFHNWLYFSLAEKIPDFINLSNGATMQHIKKSALGMVNLPIPSKKVYQSFQIETAPIMSLIVNLNQQNTKLREARDILLPRLMNGEIEV